jgi:hypothetical protein
MPKMREREKSSLKEIQAMLPKGWEIIPEYYDENSEYAIVKIRKDDLKKTSVRIVKYPPEVRAYLRDKQRRYRAGLKAQGGRC